MSFQNFLTENFSKNQVKWLSILTIILSCAVSYSGFVDANILAGIATVIFFARFCMSFFIKDNLSRDVFVWFAVALCLIFLSGSLFIDPNVTLGRFAHLATGLVIISTILSIINIMLFLTDLSRYLKKVYSKS